MSHTVTIRQERPSDYTTVEDITRRAFWNLYVPGCSEHYLVHVMRAHPDFLPELALVIEVNGQVIGSILYTKTRLVDDTGAVKDILTFGPVSILPAYQRQGYGKQLIEYSFTQAAALGYDTIVIFGNPGNYVSRGFQSCRKHRVCVEGGIYPAAMMVKVLKPGALDGRTWVYHQSPVFTIDEQAAQRLDDGLPPWEKACQPSQEEFYILSHAILP